MAEERKIYSEREKLLLASLVEQYKDIIECKKTDGVNLRRKQEVWTKICAGYNCYDVSKRTPKQLKKLWDNLKQKTRKCDTSRKNAILKTGGGPPPEDDPNPLFEKVRSIVPGIDLEIENCWDSIGSFKNDDSEKFDLVKEDLQTSTSSVTFSKEHDYAGKKDEVLRKVGHNKEDRQTSKSTIHDDEGKTEADENDSVVNEKENIACRSLSKKRNLQKKQSLKNSTLFIEEEASLRIKKIKESLEQQRELHQLKMETTNAEKEYWKKKLDLLKNGAFSEI